MSQEPISKNKQAAWNKVLKKHSYLAGYEGCFIHSKRRPKEMCFKHSEFKDRLDVLLLLLDGLVTRNCSVGLYLCDNDPRTLPVKLIRGALITFLGAASTITTKQAITREYDNDDKLYWIVYL